MTHKIKQNSGYFKRIHLVGIVWFVICVIFLIVIAINQMGFHWWVVFSVSGYSTVVVLFLITVYLFAVYKGVVRNSNSIEHPLTTSPYYILLYDFTPFMGGFAGLTVMSSDQALLLQFTIVAHGTLMITFLMWIVIDSLVGLVESSFPQSVAYRKIRLAQNREKRRLELLERQQLLEQVRQQEKQTQSQWAYFFQPYAAEVAELLCNPSVNVDTVQKRIIELGAIAWRQGELLAMEFFHEIILGELKNRYDYPSVDFVTLYWDGIGTWRKPSQIDQMYI